MLVRINQPFMLKTTAILLIIASFTKDFTFIIITLTLWVITLFSNMKDILSKNNLSIRQLDRMLSRKGQSYVEQRHYVLGLTSIALYPAVILSIVNFTVFLIFMRFILKIM